MALVLRALERDYVRDAIGQFADIPGVGDDAPLLDKLKLAGKAPSGFRIRSSKKIKTDYADIGVAEVGSPDGPQVRVGIITAESGRWDAGFSGEERKTQLRQQLTEKRDQFDSEDESNDALENEIAGLEDELETLDTERTAILSPAAMADLRRQLGDAADLAKANKAKQNATVKELEALDEQRGDIIARVSNPGLERQISSLAYRLRQKRRIIKSLEGKPNAHGWSDETIAELLVSHRAKAAELEAELAPLLARRAEIVPPEALAQLEDLDRRYNTLNDADVDDLITSVEVPTSNGGSVRAEIWGSDDEDSDWVSSRLYVLGPGETTDDADNSDEYAAFRGLKGLNKLIGGLGPSAERTEERTYFRNDDGEFAHVPGSGVHLDLDLDDDEEVIDEYADVNEHLPADYLAKYGKVIGGGNITGNLEDGEIEDSSRFDVTVTEKGGFHIAKGVKNRKVVQELDGFRARVLRDVVWDIEDGTEQLPHTDEATGVSFAKTPDGRIVVTWADGTEMPMEAELLTDISEALNAGIGSYDGEFGKRKTEAFAILSDSPAVRLLLLARAVEGTERFMRQGHMVSVHRGAKGRFGDMLDGPDLDAIIANPKEGDRERLKKHFMAMKTPELKAEAKRRGANTYGVTRKEQIADRIVQFEIGHELDRRAILGTDWNTGEKKGGGPSSKTVLDDGDEIAYPAFGKDNKFADEMSKEEFSDAIDNLTPADRARLRQGTPEEREGMRRLGRKHGKEQMVEHELGPETQSASERGKYGLAGDIAPKTTAPVAEKPLEKMTTPQLRAIAKDEGLKGISKLRKQELIDGIKYARASDPSSFEMADEMGFTVGGDPFKGDGPNAREVYLGRMDERAKRLRSYGGDEDGMRAELRREGLNASELKDLAYALNVDLPGGARTKAAREKYIVDALAEHHFRTRGLGSRRLAPDERGSSGQNDSTDLRTLLADAIAEPMPSDWERLREPLSRLSEPQLKALADQHGIYLPSGRSKADKVTKFIDQAVGGQLQSDLVQHEIGDVGDDLDNQLSAADAAGDRAEYARLRAIAKANPRGVDRMGSGGVIRGTRGGGAGPKAEAPTVGASRAGQKRIAAIDAMQSEITSELMSYATLDDPERASRLHAERERLRVERDNLVASGIPDPRTDPAVKEWRERRRQELREKRDKIEAAYFEAYHKRVESGSKVRSPEEMRLSAQIDDVIREQSNVESDLPPARKSTRPRVTKTDLTSAASDLASMRANPKPGDREKVASILKPMRHSELDQLAEQNGWVLPKKATLPQKRTQLEEHFVGRRLSSDAIYGLKDRLTELRSTRARLAAAEADPNQISDTWVAGAARQQMRELDRQIADAEADLARGGALAPKPPEQVRQQVLSAVADLEPDRGGLISLVKLRARLADVPREQQDQILKQMDRERLIMLNPDPNRKALPPQAIEAAISLGGEDKHFISRIA